MAPDVSNWLRVMVSPADVMEEEKKRADVWTAVATFGLAGLLSALIALVFFSVLNFPVLGEAGSERPEWISLAISPLANMALGTIGTGLAYLLARLLGGTGSFKTQLHLTSLYAVPAAIVGALGLVHWVLALLLMGLVFLYSVFLQYHVMRITHGLSTMRSAICAIVPALAVLAIVGVFALALLALVLASATGAL